MGKSKKKKEFDVHNMTPDEQLKFEIAQELGLDEKVLRDDHRPETAIKRGSIERKLKIQYTDTRM
mgnify:CR=1 FL=1